MTLAIAQISTLPSLAFEHRFDLPPIPAIYFALDNDRAIVYIGETENLRTRWKSHHRARQMQSGGYRIHWKEIADADIRATAERQAIEYFRPLWNRTEIPVSDEKRVMAYVNDVARYLDITPRELVCRVLMEWAYNRKETNQ